MKPITRNTLFYGDNLPILRDHIPDESIDLIYLDPPFNSNRSYNVLFKEESGQEADSQISVFDDTWHWGTSAERTYQDLIQNAPLNVVSMISALHDFIGTNQMLAYLVMMTARLVELHRVLKPTGSLYLHCDPTASHYLKVILDIIFGFDNFQNEIIWKRKTGRGETSHKSNHFGNSIDVILFYSKTKNNFFSALFNYEADGYKEYINKFFKNTDKDGRKYAIDNLASPSLRPNLIYEYKGFKPPKLGWAVSREKMEQWDKEGKLHFPKNINGRIRRKRFLDELQGRPVQNLWDDIDVISSQSAERLGYPTQKPLTLLERIIKASSNPGDWVLDPFSGCGTAIAAAQKMGRNWIGIDITHLAIAMHKSRLKDMYGLEPKKDYGIIGEPEDLEGAHQLAKDDRYQFQWWALSLIEARPVGGTEGSREGKKGSDKGMDGVIHFIDDPKAKPKRVIIQVKSGHVNSAHIRDLKGVLEREPEAAIGVLITLDSPSSDMDTEAVSSGYFHSALYDRDYPRVQILTIEQLLNGAEIKMPPTAKAAFKQADKVKEGGEQPELDIF